MRKILFHLLVSSTTVLLAACGDDATTIDADADAPTGRISSALGGPSVAAVAPASGIAGDTVTITGAGFGAEKGTSTVKFRGNFAPIVSWSDTRIVCTVPPAATAGDLTVWVTVGGTSSVPVPFTIVPSIGSITPSIVAPGQTITIAGANLGTTQRTSFVTIGGVVAAIASWSMREIVAIVPDSANGDLAVVATVSGKASAPASITTDAPTTTQPHVAGREVMYKWVDTGSIADADAILANRWPADRFEDVLLPETLTWTEDPYGDAYWRAQFYGFRPLRHLLAAYRTTHDARYLDKLLATIRSFADSGQGSAFARDRLATATRGLVLANAYWKLSLAGVLSDADAHTMLVLIDGTAKLLADPAAYDPRAERSLTESAALLTIGTSFPDLAGASSFRSLAESRLAAYVGGAIDAQGVTIDRSAYAEFQLLASLWEPAVWSRTHAPSTASALDAAIAKMAPTAAHLVQPDGRIPLVGMTPARDVRSAEVFGEIGRAHPELGWSITAGASGAAPSTRVLDLASSGWTTMRSSWASASFAGETQVFFDWRRTTGAQADRDLLNVLVYGAGRPLIVDAGMFSSDDATAAWFRSTAAHNTVLVDGQSQPEGVAFAGAVAQNQTHYPDAEPFARTAFHTAYPGVKHTRAVALLAKDIVLVLDRLESATPHTYEQLWHLTPDATQVSVDAATGVVRGLTAGGAPLVRLGSNFSTTADDNSYVPATSAMLDGVMSSAQGQTTPTYTVRFTAEGTNVVFATAIFSGDRVNDEPSVWAWADATWSDAYVWSPSTTFHVDRWLELDHGSDRAWIYDGP